MKKVAFASHITVVGDKEYDGIGNALIEEFSSTVGEFTVVRHSMDGLLPSRVIKYVESKDIETIDLRVQARPAVLRYLTEVIKTVYYFSKKDKVDVYIGVDPLNALAGIILKKIHRVNTVIFYTADYSLNRFDSGVLNRIYHLIDSYCVKNADEVWSVSTRIGAIRKEMGLDDKKNIFIPNVPPLEYAYLQKNKHARQTLIMYGVVDKQLDYEGAILAVERLKGQFKDIRLVIIGNGPQEHTLQQLSAKLGISDRVVFTGNKSHSETLAYASQAGIGLALYTGEWSFNYYGDSTKCREYFYFGLPVISTDTHSTVEDIRSFGAGIITEKNVDAYCQSIQTILGEYDRYSVASKKLGIKHEGVHRKQLTRILSE